MPFTRYLQAQSHARSASWMTKATQALRLLLDYIAANQGVFTDPHELFRGFAQSLCNGTPDEYGHDPSGLYWRARSGRSSRDLLRHIEHFTDWLASTDGTKPLNPWRDSTRYEEMLAWAAFHQRRNHSFLKHALRRTIAAQLVTKARSFTLGPAPMSYEQEAKAFPNRHIGRLLFKGFIVPGKQGAPDPLDRLNLRDILITILQHFGGIRKSEAFHLYHHDVTRGEDGLATVRIYHPSEGAAPYDFFGPASQHIRGVRIDYLRVKYGMRPRNRYPATDALYAGWKDPALNNQRHKFMHITWSNSDAGRMFYLLWTRYMEQRMRTRPEHPFAFVTKRGKPYSVSDYTQAHRRAVERIGLVAARDLGTTPHGHRHAYGQYARRIELDPVLVQRALHHKSVTSQEAYTVPSAAEVDRAMRTAEARLTNTDQVPFGREDLLTYGFEDVDPSGLLSGPHPVLLFQGKDA